jgi:hypothetical protein
VADKVADNSNDAIPHETIDDKEVLDWLARLVLISLRKAGAVLTQKLARWSRTE